MKLFTVKLAKKLYANHSLKDKTGIKPVVKFFGGRGCTWLFSEARYLDGDCILFGLCDLGAGFPELGEVSFKELQAMRFPPFGLPVERDRFFDPNKTLVEYTNEAQAFGRIVA